MPINYARLGDGTLKIGDVGTELDISAQVVGCRLTSSVDTGDTLTMLSGDSLSSGMTTESVLEGTLVLDPYTGGIGEYTWVNHGATKAFEFTPNTAAGMTVSGTLMVTRLDIGADEHGSLLQPDFSWSVSAVDTQWGTAPAAP